MILCVLTTSWAQEAEDPAPPPMPEDAPGAEMVITASRGAPGVAGAAHEIAEEELERFEQDDIQRVMVQVPGVYVRGEDGFGLRPNIGMRGANSDRSAKITLLEDGVPLAPAPYAGPAAYYFPLTTRLVGVEVFKGPAAVAYGPQTIGGAVNLLSRPVPLGWDGALDAAGGSYGSAKAHAWGGYGGENAGFLIEGVHLSSQGFKELDSGGPTGFQRQDLLAKGRLTLPGGDRNELELKLGAGREASHETYLGLSDADFEADPYRRYAASQLDYMQWLHTQESLSWSYAQSGRFALRTVAYHNYLDRSWTKLNGFAGGVDMHRLLLDPGAGQAATYAAILRGEEDSATPDQTLQIGTNARTFHNYGLMSTARLTVETGPATHTFELGARAHADRVLRLHTEDPYLMSGGSLVAAGGPTVTTLDSLGTAFALSAHARDTVEWGSLTLAPGLRVERITTAEGTAASGPMDPQTRAIALPGIAVAALPRDTFQVFAGVHRGFSPVAPGEAPEALPETAWNAEAGIRLFPELIQIELVAFGSNYSNIQGQCTLSAGCIDSDAQFSGGEAWIAGAESLLTATQELPRGLQLSERVGATVTWSAFRSSFQSDFPQWGSVQVGDALPYVPLTQGSAELVLAHDRASLALAGTWRGEMRDVAGQGPIPAEELIPRALLMDVAANIQFNPRFSGYVTVRNATNAVTMESLRPFGARPGAPRTIIAGVKVEGGPG